MKTKTILLTVMMLCASATAMSEIRHTIAAGETLSTIAEKYKVSVDALRAANPNIKKYVFTGMELIIPIRENASSTTTQSSTSTAGKQQYVQQQPVAIKDLDSKDVQPVKEAKSTITETTVPVKEEAIKETTAIKEVAENTGVTQMETQQPVAMTLTPADKPAAPTTKSTSSISYASAPANQSVRSGAKNNNVAVEYGDIEAFRQPITARLLVDYSQCTVEDTNLKLDQYLSQKGEDWSKDWPKESAECHTFFTTMYNFRNKSNTQLSTTEGDYKVIIRPEWIDFGSTGAQINPFAISPKAGGCIMRGTVGIYAPSGELLCQIYIKDVKGMGDYTFQQRLQKMYNELSSKLKKLVKD